MSWYYYSREEKEIFPPHADIEKSAASYLNEIMLIDARRDVRRPEEGDMWVIKESRQSSRGFTQLDLRDGHIVTDPDGKKYVIVKGKKILMKDNMPSHTKEFKEVFQKTEKKEKSAKEQEISEYDRIVNFYSTCKAKTKLEEEQEALGYGDWEFDKYSQFKSGQSNDWLCLLG